MLQAERLLGTGFVWNPPRWQTIDGYVPYRVLAAAARGFPALMALDRLQVARGTALGQATGAKGTSTWDVDLRLARGER